MSTLLFQNQPGAWHTVDFPAVSLTRVSWDTAPDTAVAFIFFGHMNVDFDGSPSAYGPPGINPEPDDDLANAGNAAQGWFGVAAFAPGDPLVLNGTVLLDQRPSLLKQGKFPVVQQAKNDDPNPGFFVSSTPHPTGAIYRQDSYIDASQVPFGALSGKLKALGMKLGDYGLALRHDENFQSPFYFADVGPNNFALGECSHRVGKDLGGSGSASSFNNNFPVSFIVFPESGDQDPNAVVTASVDQIEAGVKSQLASLSAADNAEDLILLMAFNEASPPNQPQGKAKLDAFRHNGGQKGSNYATVNLGLRTFGLTPP